MIGKIKGMLLCLVFVTGTIILAFVPSDEIDFLPPGISDVFISNARVSSVEVKVSQLTDDLLNEAKIYSVKVQRGVLLDSLKNIRNRGLDYLIMLLKQDWRYQSYTLLPTVRTFEFFSKLIADFPMVFQNFESLKMAYYTYFPDIVKAFLFKDETMVRLLAKYMFSFLLELHRKGGPKGFLMPSGTVLILSNLFKDVARLMKLDFSVAQVVAGSGLVFLNYDAYKLFIQQFASEVNREVGYVNMNKEAAYAYLEWRKISALWLDCLKVAKLLGNVNEKRREK